MKSTDSPSLPRNEVAHEGRYGPVAQLQERDTLPNGTVFRQNVASTREGDLVFDLFSGSGTTAVAAKALGRFFVGAELEKGYAKLAARRIGATERGGLLREISERFWSDA